MRGDRIVKMAASIKKSVVVLVLKESCVHSSTRRIFHTVNDTETFEDIEETFLCTENGSFDISVASSEDGPYSDLSNTDEMFRTPVHDLSHFNINVFKLKCKTPSAITDAAEIGGERMHKFDGKMTKNAFDILMSAKQTKRKYVSVKTSR